MRAEFALAAASAAAPRAEATEAEEDSIADSPTVDETWACEVCPADAEKEENEPADSACRTCGTARPPYSYIEWIQHILGGQITFAFESAITPAVGAARGVHGDSAFSAFAAMADKSPAWWTELRRELATGFHKVRSLAPPDLTPEEHADLIVRKSKEAAAQWKVHHSQSAGECTRWINCARTRLAGWLTLLTLCLLILCSRQRRSKWPPRSGAAKRTRKWSPPWCRSPD